MNIKDVVVLIVVAVAISFSIPVMMLTELKQYELVNNTCYNIVGANNISYVWIEDGYYHAKDTRGKLVCAHGYVNTSGVNDPYDPTGLRRFWEKIT